MATIDMQTASGATIRTVTNPMDVGQSTACATLEKIEVTDRGLMLTQRVLDAGTGKWRMPRYETVKSTHSETTSGAYISANFYDERGSTTDSYQVTNTVDPMREYMLASSKQLENVTEIVIDGSLAYQRVNDTLVPCVGGVSNAQQDNSWSTDDMQARIEPSGACETGVQQYVENVKEVSNGYSYGY